MSYPFVVVTFPFYFLEFFLLARAPDYSPAILARSRASSSPAVASYSSTAISPHIIAFQRIASLIAPSSSNPRDLKSSNTRATNSFTNFIVFPSSCFHYTFSSSRERERDPAWARVASRRVALFRRSRENAESKIHREFVRVVFVFVIRRDGFVRRVIYDFVFFRIFVFRCVYVHVTIITS